MIKIKANKKLGLIILILLIIIGVVVYVLMTNRKENMDGNIQIAQHESEQTESVPELEETGEVEEFEYTIKSTERNQIEKDGIEAQSIHIKSYADELEITTILKNNSKESLNGYMIEIELLDDKGNTITTISENSQDVIEAGQTKEILNYVVGLENQKEIKNAKIVNLEKSSISDAMEQTFDDMTPDETKEEQIQE